MIYLLAGNPNVGKSTFFNAMTQSHVHVGNYSGVTVEKRVHHIKDYPGANLVDLPGTYNVSPNSEDEGVVTYSLLNESYKGIINIIDSTHLKRNLHLSIQLLELGVPTLLVFNLKDALRNNGFIIDTTKVESLLGVNAVSVSARERCKDDQALVVENLKDLQAHKAIELDYPLPVKKGIHEIHELLRHDIFQVKKKWIALQLLEGNEGIYEYLDLRKEEDIRNIVARVEQEVIDQNIALSLKGAIFNTRRAYIESIIETCLIQVEEKEHSKYFNQKIDRFITHPIYGVPLFFFVMFSIYQISFGTFLGLGNYLTGWFEIVWDDVIVHYTALFLETVGVGGFIFGLTVDGILAGVGGVLVFLPQIIVLFTLIAILEGTGYMARVAIMMDRFLSKFGFNGKSIVPMITGLGCTVPAIMATRTIADKKERLLTILTVPFISCSARLPIYGLIVSKLFNQYNAMIIFGIYLLGIIVTLFSAKLLHLTYFKGEGSKFLLEVPPYRMPQIRTVLYQALEKARRFVKKAGTFILIGSMILWVLANNGFGGILVDQNESFLASIAGGIKYVFIPLGFGTWEASSSLISGFLAKEVVASSLEILYPGGIAGAFTIASGVSFVIFTSLYIPCISTVATIKAETQSTKWTLFSVAYPFVLAYLLSLIVYWFFVLIGLG